MCINPLFSHSTNGLVKLTQVLPIQNGFALDLLSLGVSMRDETYGENFADAYQMELSS